MRSLKSMHLPWIALLRSGVGLLGNEVERGVKARQGLDADAQAELAAAGVDQ